MASRDAVSHDKEAEKGHCPNSRIMQNCCFNNVLLVLTMLQERFPSINNGKTLIHNFNIMPCTGHPVMVAVQAPVNLAIVFISLKMTLVWKLQLGMPEIRLRLLFLVSLVVTLRTSIFRQLRGYPIEQVEMNLKEAYTFRTEKWRQQTGSKCREHQV